MRNGSRAMKKLLLLGVGTALAFTMGGIGSAQADNGPHVSSAKGVGANQAVTSDKCAGCHRIHTAKSNDGMLLKTTTQEALCFNCHGPAASGASTNVVDGVGYENAATGVQDRDRSGAAGALRGGGFTNARINGGGASADFTAADPLRPTRIRAVESSKLIPVLPAGSAVTSTHSVGTAGTAWGNGAVGSGVGKSISLECGSCHDPHGNGNYRILKPIPADSGTSSSTDALGVATTGVAIPDANKKVYTTTNYWLSGDRNVPATAGGVPDATGLVADGYIKNVAQWCTTCHTRYNAPSGSRSTPLVDAAGTVDQTYMYRHTSTENTKVSGSKNCITCHVSHGSNASGGGTESSRVLNPGDTAVTAGDSRLLRVDNRGVCLMCHNV
jgi:predicted CXXCH cytochrome family protein